jgi:hypothetical protein
MRALEEQPEVQESVKASELRKARAEAEKERGNDAFKAKDFKAAVVHYSAAIEADNTNATFYSNR